MKHSRPASSFLAALTTLGCNGAPPLGADSGDALNTSGTGAGMATGGAGSGAAGTSHASEGITGGTPSRAGASATGSSMAGAATVAVAGMSGSLPATGGTTPAGGAGGESAGGGSTVAAGAGAGAMDAGGAGAGGSTLGGSGGDGSAGSGGSRGSEPAPSQGCSGGDLNAMIANSIVDKPDGYDGSTPLPLVIALHANGNPNTQLQGYFGQEGKVRGYLLVYPKSAGSSWNFQSDRSRIDDAYDGMLQNYCVDTNRVYGIGHSGGAQTLTQLLCQGDDRFRAVAPVASSKYCNGWDAVAAIVIHGTCDQERGGSAQNPECTSSFPDKYGVNDVDGLVDFGVYRDSNTCSEQSTPFTPGGNCGSNVDPGCVEYEGCAARTQFCNHDDPEYGGTNHGVPCFAAAAVFDFFDEEN